MRKRKGSNGGKASIEQLISHRRRRAAYTYTCPWHTHAEHTRQHTRQHRLKQTNAHTYTHANTHAHTHTHTHKHIYTQIHTHTHILGQLHEGEGEVEQQEEEDAATLRCLKDASHKRPHHREAATAVSTPRGVDLLHVPRAPVPV